MRTRNTKICIDADIGEGFGPYRIGDDEALMPFITSANIACGFHAGDPVVMARSIRLARSFGVCIGAHPGFNDVQGFGRRNITMSEKAIEYMVTYQIGALDALATAEGTHVSYVKPHGALNNMAHSDPDLARAIARGVRAAGKGLIFVANCLSAMVRAAQDAGLCVVHEAYVDRDYLPDGRLMPRNQRNSVISDPDIAAARTFRMLDEQCLIAAGGTKLASPIDTFCIHSDEPAAVAIARKIMETAVQNGLEATRVDGLCTTRSQDSLA